MRNFQEAKLINNRKRPIAEVDKQLKFDIKIPFIIKLM